MSFCFRGDRASLLAGDMLNGAARLRGPNNRELTVIFSDGDGWEHVSVSTPTRCPNWPEMCFVKDLFWGPGDEVVQFHPAKENYVNLHPYVLHLWRQPDAKLSMPPLYMV